MEDIFGESNDQSKFARKGEKFRKRLEQFVYTGDFGTTTIHPYQAKAVLKVKEMLDADTGEVPEPCLIVAPTGSGKSGMIAMLPYVLQSKKVLILTPSAIISNQLAEAFGQRSDKRNCFFSVARMCQDREQLEQFLENVNVISTVKDTEKTRGNLVIVNAQKFGGRAKLTLSLEYRNEVLFESAREFFSEFDTLIVDEAHHYQAKTWKQIVHEFKSTAAGLDKKIIFLTATPIIGYSKEYVPIFVLPKERIAYAITPEMCIGKSTRPVLFDEQDDADNLVRDIIEILGHHSKLESRFKPQAMVLVNTIDQANQIAEILNDVAIQCNGYIADRDEPLELDDDGQNDSFAVAVSGKAIKAKLDNFTAGKHRVAITCKVGLEGYDNTRVTLCVIYRKIVTGRIMFAQFVGRCLRLKRNLGGAGEKTDKTMATVLSYREFNQRMLFNELNTFTTQDPTDENDSNE